jgi:hypothetical protein
MGESTKLTADSLMHCYWFCGLLPAQLGAVARSIRIAKWSALSSPISIFRNVFDIGVITEQRRYVKEPHYKRNIFQVHWGGLANSKIS